MLKQIIRTEPYPSGWTEDDPKYSEIVVYGYLTQTQYDKLTSGKLKTNQEKLDFIGLGVHEGMPAPGALYLVCRDLLTFNRQTVVVENTYNFNF